MIRFRLRRHGSRGGRRRVSARLIVLAAIGLATAGVHACGEDSTEPHIPVPGQLDVTLVSPNGDEGAVVLQASGGGINAVTVAGGEAFLGGSAATTRIVVLLSVPGVIQVTLDVDDLGEPPQLAIVEVADGANRLRADLSGYSLQVSERSAALTAEVTR